MDEEKYIDESWKESVEKEKQAADGQPSFSSSSSEVPEASQDESSEVNFIGYLTSLAFQVMVFLGEIPNPLSNQVEKNLIQAKFLIDTLVLLREKTKGNLNKEESDTLNGFIYELQVKYVEAVEKERKDDRQRTS